MALIEIYENTGLGDKNLLKVAHSVVDAKDLHGLIFSVLDPRNF